MLAQISRFAGVGLIATLTHVCAALVAQGGFGAPAQLANFIGFCCAVALSYFGHAHFTFGVTDAPGTRLPRFVTVSLLGLAVSSGITFIVHTQMGFAFPVAMALVAVTVPAMTFVGAKLWAFAVLRRNASDG